MSLTGLFSLEAPIDADATPGKLGSGNHANRLWRLVRTTMFLGIAFTEALALIGFVVFILLKFT